MKKVFIVFVFCCLAIFTTFILTNYNVSFDSVAIDIGAFASRLTGKTEVEYSNEIKVNRLQMRDATVNYNKLNDNQKKIYSAIALAVRDLNEVVSLDNYTDGDLDQISEDVKTVMNAFFADHPEVFYLNLTYRISLSKSILNERIRIDLSYSVANKNELELKLNVIESVMNAYLIDLEGKSDFEKELLIHDNIALNVKYYSDTSDISKVPEVYHSIYGVFVEKQAVCDGFSKAMQLLLDRVNIDTMFVTGMIGSVPHAWNLVKLDNEWYHLDLTSDKYIKESDGTTKTVVHTYFNVTDEFIKKSHTIDDPELLPVANATSNNYYIKTNSYITNTDNFENKIKELVEIQKNRNALEFASNVSDVPTKLLNVLYNINFNGYKSNGMNVKMRYYNEFDTYIVQKH